MSRKYSLLILLVAVVALIASISLISAQGNVDVYGRELPEDAAPYEMQVMRNLCNSTRTEVSLSSIVSVYSRICDRLHLTSSLIRLSF